MREQKEDNLKSISGEEMMVFMGTRGNQYSVPTDDVIVSKWNKIYFVLREQSLSVWCYELALQRAGGPARLAFKCTSH